MPQPPPPVPAKRRAVPTYLFPDHLVSLSPPSSFALDVDVGDVGDSSNNKTDSNRQQDRRRTRRPGSSYGDSGFFRGGGSFFPSSYCLRESSLRGEDSVYEGTAVRGGGGRRRRRRKLLRERAEKVYRLLLGGLFSSVLLFPLLHLAGRTRLLACSSAVQAAAMALLMAPAPPDDGKDDDGVVVLGWLLRLAPFLCGAGLGAQLALQQLFVAETAAPRRRSALGLLSHLLSWLGAAVAHLAITATTVATKMEEALMASSATAGVLLLLHAVVMGFLHPDTPRSLYGRDRKADCVNSLQWLRGASADIGAEYADLSDAMTAQAAQAASASTAARANDTEGGGVRVRVGVGGGGGSWGRRRWCCRCCCWSQEQLESLMQRSLLQPILTSVTVTALSSLSGLVTFAAVLVGDLDLNAANKEADRGGRGLEDQESRRLWLERLFLCLSCLSPALSLLLVSRAGSKFVLLCSAAASAAAALFLALISHFSSAAFGMMMMTTASQHGENEESGLNLHGWVVPLSAVAFLLSHQFGVGPAAMSVSLERLPVRLLGPAASLVCAAWWAVNLLFALTVDRLLVWVGLAGICWMHFSVCVLLYAFLLLMLPDTRGASLEEIQFFYANCDSWDATSLEEDEEEEEDDFSTTSEYSFEEEEEDATSIGTYRVRI